MIRNTAKHRSGGQDLNKSLSGEQDPVLCRSDNGQMLAVAVALCS